MDSIDLGRIAQRARRKYEWSRARRAVIGFAPASLLVAAAVLFGSRPTSALTIGALMFIGGTALLWYGRDLRRAVLPGIAAGSVPLTLALCANRFGHFCTSQGCTSLCVPACVVGGLAAGIAVAVVGHRGQHGSGYWLAASSIALLTGAMGCACVGYAGVAGLAAGFGVGLVPSLVQGLRRR